MDGERTEPASPRKLRRARARGQVWRSRELTSAVILLSAAAALAWQGPATLERLRAFMAQTLRAACSSAPPAPGLVLEAALSTTVACLAPFAISAALAAALAGLIQIGPLFTLAPLAPDLRRLDPFLGVKRLFSTSSLVTAALALVKVVVVVLVLVWTLSSDLRDLSLLGRATPAAAAGAVIEVLGTLLARGALALVALSLLDLLYQRRRFLKEQRMTKHEVEQEQRETEGDQSRRGERRRLHRELLEQAPRQGTVDGERTAG